nr:hypothetical protein [uncultured Blautia sp.]
MPFSKMVCISSSSSTPFISLTTISFAGQVLGKLETMSDAEFAEVALEAAE